MKIKEKYYRFAEKGQQIQRVNRFFVTEYLIFYAFILFMLWASRAKGVRSLGFAAFVSVIAVVSGGALLIGWKRRPESERLRYLALIGLYLVSFFMTFAYTESFIRFVHAQSAALSDQGTEIAEKLKLLSDGLVQNWAMWITVIAFVVVVLLVNLLRTRAFDYAWRIAIIVGGVTYILIILAGDFCLDVTVSMIPMIVSTVASVLVGFVLEFFVFGGDYSRTERLEYEDDEYYYYVKAVPKASVSTSERSIKKINAEPVREEKKKEDRVVFRDEDFSERKDPRTVSRMENFENTVSEKPQEIDEIDFEKQLEESLKDL